MPEQYPDDTDWSKPLAEDVDEKFAQECFQNPNRSYSDVYRELKPDSKGWENQSVWVNSSKMHAKVAPRIEWLFQNSANSKIASKQRCCEILTQMAETTIADFVSIDQDGELFVEVTKKTMAVFALKKVKLKKIVDESGNTVMGIHLTELELEGKVSIIKAISDIMGYSKADYDRGRAADALDRLLDEIGTDNADPDPQNG